MVAQHNCCDVVRKPDHSLMANRHVLNKLPQGLQEKAKAGLHEIWMAERRVDAEQAFNNFLLTV